MGASSLLAGSELRRRLSSLAGLALIVAFVGAVVSGALVGAHRTSTSVERFRDWAHASDGNFQSSSDREATALRRLLERRSDVEAVAQRRLVNAFLNDSPISDIAIMSDPEGRYAREVDRPRLLRGRMPAVGAPDEIVLNELAARLAGARIGDVLHARTWSRTDLENLFAGDAFPGFNGPQVVLRVVGVARTLDGLPGDVERTAPYGIGSPAFLGAHPAVGVWPPDLYVRTTGGASTFAAVARAVAATRVPDTGDAHFSSGTPAGTTYLNASQQAVNSATSALLMFAAAAALVGAIVLGQAVQRHLSGSASPALLTQLGMTRSQTARARAIPVAVAAVTGVVLGAAVAVPLSRLLPIGLAGRAEVHPGVWVDPLVLLACAVVVVALLSAFAFVAARRTGGARTEGVSARRASASVRAVTGVGMPPVVETGVRFAAERKVGMRTLPVRTAFAGLAVAVAGIATTAVLSTSYTRLAHQPARWGWNWSSEPDYFGKATTASVMKRLISDPRVDAVGRFDTGSVLVDGSSDTSGYALTALKGDMALTLRRGRLPTSRDEVALGEATLARAKTHIGGLVNIARRGSTTTEALMVVGTVVFPPTETRVVDTGTAFTPAGLVAHGQDEPTQSIVLRYPAHSDVRTIETGLARDYGLEFNPFTDPQVPGVVRKLSETRTVAIALAVFFALLGTIALANALVATVTRRRAHIGVLRTLGFRPTQVRAAVVVQAIALGLAAVAVGLPIGLVAGRALWRLLTNDVGALDGPSTPWLVIAAAVPVAVVWTTALAWWPARHASRERIAAALRAE